MTIIGGENYDKDSENAKLISNMKIVVLTSFDVAGAIILNEIIDHINLVGVFIQRSNPLKVKDILKRSKIMPGFLGFFMKIWRYFTNQETGIRFYFYRYCEIICFLIFNNTSVNDKKKYLLIDRDVLKKHAVYNFITDDINSGQCVQLINKINPDLIITIGGKVLKKNIITIPPKGVINIHNSILPKYRGAASEFWAIYNRDIESIGVTVHYINEGVDSGEIILQEKQKNINNYDLDLIHLNNLYLGAKLLKKAICLIDKGQVKAQKQNEEDASFYRFPDRVDKKKFELTRKELLKKLHKS